MEKWHVITPVSSVSYCLLRGKHLVLAPEILKVKVKFAPPQSGRDRQSPPVVDRTRTGWDMSEAAAALVTNCGAQTEGDLSHFLGLVHETLSGRYISFWFFYSASCSS